MLYFCNPKNLKNSINNLKIKEMKKVLFAMAIAGMFSFVACNNNAPAEEAEPVAEEMVVEETVDTTVVENAVEEIANAAVEGVAEAVAE